MGFLHNPQETVRSAGQIRIGNEKGGPFPNYDSQFAPGKHLPGYKANRLGWTAVSEAGFTSLL